MFLQLLLPNFHECFYNSIGKTQTKKETTLIIKMQILFARAIIMSTAHASSVFLSSCRNTILNQSVRVFSKKLMMMMELGTGLLIFSEDSKTLTSESSMTKTRITSILKSLTHCIVLTQVKMTHVYHSLTSFP